MAVPIRHCHTVIQQKTIIMAVNWHTTSDIKRIYKMEVQKTLLHHSQAPQKSAFITALLTEVTVIGTCGNEVHISSIIQTESTVRERERQESKAGRLTWGRPSLLSMKGKVV